jgi:hypothetical protein
VYSLTDDGRDMLDAWSLTLAKNREILGMFLQRVAGLETAGVAERRSQPAMVSGGGEA